MKQTKFLFICLGVLLAAGAVGAYEHQLELKFGNVQGDKEIGRGRYSNGAMTVGGFYEGKLKLAEGLSLELQDEFDGLIQPSAKFDTTFHTTDNSISGFTGYALNRPLFERNIPNQNRGILELRYQKNFDAGISFENIYYIKPDRVSQDYLPSKTFTGDSMSHSRDSIKERPPQRVMRSAVALNAKIPIKDLSIGIDEHLFSLKYDHIYAWTDANDVFEAFAKSPGTDQDLWTSGLLEYNFPSGFFVNVLASFKNNVTGNHELDIYHYTVSAGGQHEVPSVDNKLTWTLAGAFLASKNLDSNAFATGYHGTLYLRDVYMLVTGFYIKGMLALDYGEAGMLKQRYELSVRYAGSSESSTEIGYYALHGGLFPLQAIFCNNRLNRGSFYASANANASWLGPQDVFDTAHIKEGNFLYPLLTFFNFAKAYGEVEIGYDPAQNFTVFIGGNMAHFVGMRTGYNFPNRLGAYIGVRSLFR